MMRNVFGWFIALLVVAVIGYQVVVEANKHPYKEYEAQLAAERANATPVNVDMNDLKLVAVAIVGIVALVLIGRFATAHPLLFGVGLVALLVVGGLFYYTGFNKKGETQAITMVQPSGSDYVVDAQYAEINQTNSTTNVISASSFGLYVLVILAVVIVVGKVVKSFI